MQLFVPGKPPQAKDLKQSKAQRPLKSETESSEKTENFFYSTWKAFSSNTSIHGVHYLTETSFNLMEKLLWALALFLATAFMVYSCIMLSNRFNTSMTSTVFESTNWKVSEIPFPGVTICNNNRLNYNKTDEAFDKFFPNGSKTERETFVKFVHVLQNMEIGSFDEFGVIEKDNITKLNTVNISKIYEFMMHTCEDFFAFCWWRNAHFNCCEWFSKQRCEYGFCWSFNSFTNVGSKFINRSHHFPWRVSRHGRKTALKVILNTRPETRVDRTGIANSNPGVMIMSNHPYQWPVSSRFISAGSIVALKIRPTAYSTSEEVESLDPQERQCNYNHESEELNLTHLSGLPYLRANCMAECRQTYMMKFCNCSVGFIYPAVNYPECNVSGLLCLIEFNDYFNAEKPQDANPFFDDDEEGLKCSCLPECSRVDYATELSQIYGERKINENFVLIDIHFGNPTMMKYRTDVTFSDMDLLVGFGGIVSLFLGCSLLSGAEILYFGTVGLFWHRERIRAARMQIVKNIKMRIPFLH